MKDTSLNQGFLLVLATSAGLSVLGLKYVASGGIDVSRLSGFSSLVVVSLHYEFCTDLDP